MPKGNLVVERLQSDDLMRSRSVLDLYFDGATEPKNPGGVCCSAWVLKSPSTEELGSTSRLLATGRMVVADGGENATNNYAEYCGLGLGLKFLCDLGWRGGILNIFGDSQLVCRQITKEWRCNYPHLQDLRSRIWQRLMELGCMADAENFNDHVTITWVPRDQNQEADELTKLCYREYTGRQMPVRQTRRRT